MSISLPVFTPPSPCPARPKWKGRDDWFLMRWISPYDTLEVGSPLWSRIIRSYPLRLEVIRYLCSRVIKSSEGDYTRGQLRRADYRMWQVETLYRLVPGDPLDITSLVTKARRAYTDIATRDYNCYTIF
jgi:hypothetical protein